MEVNTKVDKRICINLFNHFMNNVIGMDRKGRALIKISLDVEASEMDWGLIRRKRKLKRNGVTFSFMIHIVVLRENKA